MSDSSLLAPCPRATHSASQTLCSHKALMDQALKSVYYFFCTHLTAEAVANDLCLSPIYKLRKCRLPVGISC